MTPNPNNNKLKVNNNIKGNVDAATNSTKIESDSKDNNVYPSKFNTTVNSNLKYVYNQKLH